MENQKRTDGAVAPDEFLKKSAGKGRMSEKKMEEIERVSDGIDFFWRK